MENHIQMDLGKSKDKDWYLLLTCTINDQKSCITLVLPSQPAGMVQWGVSKCGSVGCVLI